METPENYEDLMRERHESIWKTRLNNKNRIISQGDLRFDLNQNILAVIPYYYDKDSSSVINMRVVTGTIVNINYLIVKPGQDIPRQMKLRDSPEKTNIYSGSREWAKSLITTSWKENTSKSIQTYIVSYDVELDDEFVISQKQMDVVNKFVEEQDLPFRYDLKLKDNVITIDYRYIMSMTYDCKKHLGDIIRKDHYNIKCIDIENYIGKLKLKIGCKVRYTDVAEHKRNSGIIQFTVIDYICLGSLDIKFVIKCHNTPKRILPITKIHEFNVRSAYDISNYHLFHALDRYRYEIVEEHLPVKPNRTTQNILENIFGRLEVFTVKKSLCNPSDMDASVYENSNGDYQILKKTENAYVIKRGFRFTGICLSSYVKGLAYPQGKRPENHDGYIFFHSKDYIELTLDPSDVNFLDLSNSTSKHLHYRNPLPKDTILAEPFICNRGIFSGKTNLKWFYPSNSFRLLHLYITSKGENPMFEGKSHDEIISRLGNENYLVDLFNLYVFGTSDENSTLKSEFTKQFISKFLQKW